MYYEKLNTQEKGLVESQLSNNQKNMIVAYLLWLFGGGLGLHRFYIKGGIDTSALIQLGLTVSGWLTSFILIGFIPLFIVGAWVFIDAFLIPGLVRGEADQLREEYAERVYLDRQQQ